MINLNKLDQVFIVAEIGANHNQNIELAKEMIIAAKEAGADAVKFQSINIEELYLKPSEKTKKLHEQIDLNEKWHYELKEFCDKNSTIFFSTPTYLKAIEILEDIDVELYKLASAQIGTFPVLVQRVAQLKKPTLLSTGIVTFSELENTVKVFHDSDNNNFCILHCNSIYPTPFNKVNLKMIEVYSSMFGATVGFSDHTRGIYSSLAAVTLGAKVIERHFVTDKKVLTPDVEISLLPSEFKEMVAGIRAIEQSLEVRSRIELETEEFEFKESILYRLILKKYKQEGDDFSHDDFIFKRHDSGVDCRDIKVVVEKMLANTNLDEGDLLTWDNLKGKIL